MGKRETPLLLSTLHSPPTAKVADVVTRSPSVSFLPNDAPCESPSVERMNSEIAGSIEAQHLQCTEQTGYHSHQFQHGEAQIGDLTNSVLSPARAPLELPAANQMPVNNMACDTPWGESLDNPTKSTADLDRPLDNVGDIGLDLGIDCLSDAEPCKPRLRLKRGGNTVAWKPKEVINPGQLILPPPSATRVASSTDVQRYEALQEQDREFRHRGRRVTEPELDMAYAPPPTVNPYYNGASMMGNAMNPYVVNFFNLNLLEFEADAQVFRLTIKAFTNFQLAIPNSDIVIG